jgi:peptidoglycan hydrolase CwlO-like protein
MKKLVGKTDIEDALGQLDRLTQDEGWMAAASGLKATHDVDDKVQAVDKKVQGVDDKVQAVDDKVQGVDDKVQAVDNKVQAINDNVQGVNDKVQGVDNRVRDVDHKIDLIIDGVQFLFQLSSTPHLIYLARW